jgi:hypothetical protein
VCDGVVEASGVGLQELEVRFDLAARRGRGDGVVREAWSGIWARLGAAESAEVIVDSSNWPVFGHLAHEVLDDVRYLHLIRDPRGALHSRLRKERARVPAATLARDAARWIRWNREAGALSQMGRPYVQVRYEDLVESPESSFTAVATALGIPSPKVVGMTAHRQREHVLWGNLRSQAGRTEVRPDRRWQTEAPVWQRIGSLALTAPSKYSPLR